MSIKISIHLALVIFGRLIGFISVVWSLCIGTYFMMGGNTDVTLSQCIVTLFIGLFCFMVWWVIPLNEKTDKSTIDNNESIPHRYSI